MVQPPKKDDGVQVDPRGGDEILKRMLKTKPKTHQEMVKGRHAGGDEKQKRSDK